MDEEALLEIVKVLKEGTWSDGFSPEKREYLTR